MLERQQPTSSRHHELAASTRVATARPRAADPSDTTTSKGEPADSRATADCTCSTERMKGQAASTLALSCSNSAWVMAPLSRRPLADAISSAALLEDPAATDLT